MYVCMFMENNKKKLISGSDKRLPLRACVSNFSTNEYYSVYIQTSTLLKYFSNSISSNAILVGSSRLEILKVGNFNIFS